MDQIEKIAAAVLYEGYVLWPYRRSATKNQKRWSIGGVFPRAYSEDCGGHDPWLMQTQCLVAGEDPAVRAQLRFLHVVHRQVGRLTQHGTLEPVDSLEIGSERYIAWEESVEREIASARLKLSELAAPNQVGIVIPAGSAEEPLTAPDGAAVGALLRSWLGLTGAMEVSAEPVHDGLFKLTVKVTNTTPWSGQDRERTLKQTFVSAHVLLTVDDGGFISQTDPPEELREIAGACENVKTWPVLIGEADDQHTMLSAPIILEDYPRIAPESSGDLFDGTEIDQMLLMNTLTLTDDEKGELRATDPRVRAILERSESMTADDFMNLHGTIREFRVLQEEPQTDLFMDPFLDGLEKPAPESVMVDGVKIVKGSRVLLHPRSGGDIIDIALAGKVAFIEGIDQDYEDKIYLAVTIEDDPGRDLGEARQPGHRFFFSPDEVEPLDAERRA